MYGTVCLVLPLLIFHGSRLAIKKQLKFNILFITFTVWCIFLIARKGYFGFEIQILDFLSAVTLSIASWHIKKFDTDYSKLRNVALFTLIMILSFILVKYFELEKLRESTIDIFGNENLASEIIGILLTLVVVKLYEVSNFLKRALLGFVISIGLYVVFLLQSRAVLLGLIVMLILNLAFVLKQKKYMLFFLPIMFSMIFIIFLKTTPYLENLKNIIQLDKDEIATQLSTTKHHTSITRLVRWENTLKMIFENLDGIGPNKYSFAYLSYFNSASKDPEINEFVLSKSPHNIYLEAIVEYGLIGFVLIAYGIFFIMVTALQDFKINPLSGTTSLNLLAFTLTEGIFAFPLESAFPFYSIFGILGAYFFEERKVETRNLIQDSTQNFLKIIFKVVVIISFVLLVAAVSFAKIVEKNFSTDPTMTNFSCILTKEVWQNCISNLSIRSENLKNNQILDSEYETQETDSIVAEAQKLLKLDKNNFYAMRIILKANFIENNMDELCPVVDKIYGIFPTPRREFWLDDLDEAKNLCSH